MDCSTADPDDDPDNPLWVSSWSALEKLYAEGRVKGIGLSNANYDEHLLRFETDGRLTLMPHVVQNYMALEQRDMNVVGWCVETKVLFQAYGLLRNLTPYQLHALQPIADVMEATPRQVLIKWLVQRHIGVIARSKNPDHIVSNLRPGLSQFHENKIWMSPAELHAIDEIIHAEDPKLLGK